MRTIILALNTLLTALIGLMMIVVGAQHTAPNESLAGLSLFVLGGLGVFCALTSENTK